MKMAEVHIKLNGGVIAVCARCGELPDDSFYQHLAKRKDGKLYFVCAKCCGIIHSGRDYGGWSAAPENK